MSRVFRRPMFRGGSTNMNGIMSGIEDRENFQDGTTAERLQKIAEQYPDQGISPLNQFLIQGGLNLMSQPSTGSTLGDIATAAKAPTAQLLKDLSARGQLRKKLALEGEVMDIESEQAEKLARIKASNKDFFAAQTPEAQFEVLFKGYNDSSIPAIKAGATNLAKFEVEMNLKNQDYSQLGFKFGKDSGGKKGYIPDWSSIPVGFVTYNPQTNLAYKRVSRDTNTAQDYIPLNPSTLQPLE